MDLTTIATIAGISSAGIVTLTAAGRAISKPLRKLTRDNDEFREDWYGRPARYGRERQPGVVERLSDIEKELHTNGGGTLRDAIHRLENRLEEHIRTQTSERKDVAP